MHRTRPVAPWSSFSRCLLILALFPAVASASSFDSLEGQPGLRSAAALVVDAEGNVIYGKDEDSVRPVASLTKLMTAMVVLDGGQDLNEQLTITRDDRDRLKLTGSRLDFGATLTREELLLLAVMSSENRAAAALGRNWPGGIVAFVDAMNEKARALGMASSEFVDPAGLNPRNRASARDLMKMLRAAEAYPLIHRASTTQQMTVRPWANRGPLTYRNTNRLLKNDTWDIALSKTGYINESGRCLVMKALIEGQPVSIVLLNSFGKLTPFGDSNRLRRWLMAGG